MWGEKAADWCFSSTWLHKATKLIKWLFTEEGRGAKVHSHTRTHSEGMQRAINHGRKYVGEHPLLTSSRLNHTHAGKQHEEKHTVTPDAQTHTRHTLTHCVQTLSPHMHVMCLCSHTVPSELLHSPHFLWKHTQVQIKGNWMQARRTLFVFDIKALYLCLSDSLSRQQPSPLVSQQDRTAGVLLSHFLFSLRFCLFLRCLYLVSRWW